MKYRRYLLHLLFWSLYLLSQGLIWMNAFETEQIVISPDTGREIITRSSFPGTFLSAVKSECAELPGKLLAVYVNLYVLIPVFLLKKNWLQYSFALLVLLALVAVFQRCFAYHITIPLLFPEFSGEVFFISPTRFVQYFAITANLVAFTGAVKILRRYYEEKRRAVQAEKERLATELQYLKAQVNPHFFFNTLNNLYGLALEKSDKTPALLLRLSEIMSYVLYESNAAGTPLEKELHILENFVELEKLRHGDWVVVTYSVQGETAAIRLPPLLLLPFVENAFKHSPKDEKLPGRIRILLHVRDGILDFKVENDIGTNERATPKNNGIGLENVRRRLELLLPGRHELSIQAREGMFYINLKISK